MLWPDSADWFQTPLSTYVLFVFVCWSVTLLFVIMLHMCAEFLLHGWWTEKRRNKRNGVWWCNSYFRYRLSCQLFSGSVIWSIKCLKKSEKCSIIEWIIKILIFYKLTNWPINQIRWFSGHVWKKYRFQFSTFIQYWVLVSSKIGHSFKKKH